jgi:hypothetical protein
VLAERWRCRPSEADEEPALWVLRQKAADSVRRRYQQLQTLEFDDED